MQKRVNVLISTYNGENYIEEQLESIESQTYQNIKIFVRDDGSQDGTIKILERWEESGRIILIKGDNIGYGKSFLKLLEIVKEGDYWAYCDQDDVWLPNKIQWAVEWFDRQEDKDEPLMFHSSFAETDEKLNVVREYLPPTYDFTFQMAITECLHLGFSSVMNKKLRELVLQGDIDHLVTHDWWTELIVMEFGRVHFDDRIASFHRRLDRSVSGMTLKKRFQWLIRTMKEESEITVCTREFKRVFTNFKKEDMALIDCFVMPAYSLRKSLKKALYPKRWRSSFSSELTVRILMLIGRI